jgi:LmbE family N-acetylglucosaminyl deacetylase
MRGTITARDKAFQHDEPVTLDAVEAMKMRPFKLLVVFAHPDDESFAVGGTLAKYAAEGVEVVIVSATRGEAGIRGVDTADAAAIRASELHKAAARIGASEVRFLGYRDRTLPEIDPDEAVARLVALLRELRPQVLVTFGPDGISGHPDHVTINRWATAAFDALDGPGAPQKLYYVAPSLATQQSCQVTDPPPLPADAVGIDVGAHLETKVRAIQAHASQEPPYPGDPAQEAQKLVCHEWFVMARSRLPLGSDQKDDLFAGLR